MAPRTTRTRGVAIWGDDDVQRSLVPEMLAATPPVMLREALKRLEDQGKGKEDGKGGEDDTVIIVLE